jgi:hypothetical protein
MDDRSRLIAALNERWHHRALQVFAAVAIAHWTEHVLQAAEIYLLGWPAAKATGALGLVWPGLVTSEWLHYVYNGALLGGIWLLRPGFTGPARDWWTSALILQLWHHAEHLLLLGQASTGRNLLGGPMPRSLVQLVVPRVQLHLFYNTVVLVPLVVAVVLHVFDPAEGRRCRCAVRRLPRSARWRWATAIALVLVVPALPVAALPGDPPAELPSTRSVHAMIRPLGPTSVPQGMPFAFRAELRNGSRLPVAVSVRFELAGPGSGPVAFDRWNVAVPPASAIERRVELTTSQWFAGIGTYEVRARPAFGSNAMRLEVTSPTVPVPRFEDVTEQAGVATTLSGSECGAWSAGAAWGDVDLDGDLDLFLPRRNEPSHLWIQEHGRFADQAVARGVADARGLGAVFVDYDNDGDEDLYVNARGADLLFRNDGRGRFANVAPSVGLADGKASQGAAWGDYDRDGDLDLFVANHLNCVGDSQITGSTLYRNEGGRLFSDQTRLLAGDGMLGAGFQAAWTDFDSDGDLDLYLGNDYVGPAARPNVLWRNDGPGAAGTWRFSPVPRALGAQRAINSMGIGVADVDGDLDLDLALSNMGPTLLLENDGASGFRERGTAARVARPWQNADLMSVTWGLVFADLNNDGWEDLYVPAGDLGPGLLQPNALFTNAGDGSFLDHSAPSGAADPGTSRGVAVADYDRDGRVDLFVVNQDGRPRLYRNVTPNPGHWLEVHAVGTRSNRSGCGVRLVVRAGGRTMLRERSCGGQGLGSGGDHAVHFGLGDAARVDELVVEWTSGTRQVLRDVAGDRLIRLVEPRTG